jgi:hypothetical protein
MQTALVIASSAWALVIHVVAFYLAYAHKQLAAERDLHVKNAYGFRTQISGLVETLRDKEGEVLLGSNLLKTSREQHKSLLAAHDDQKKQLQQETSIIQAQDQKIAELKVKIASLESTKAKPAPKKK